MCQVASVLPKSLQPDGLWPAKFLCSWDSPGKNTGVGWHFLLQRIFQIQGLNPHLSYLIHWHADSIPLQPHGYLGLNLRYFTGEILFQLSSPAFCLPSLGIFMFLFLPLQRYCNREEQPWLHIESIHLTLLLCCLCLEMLALYILWKDVAHSLKYTFSRLWPLKV